jgi:hypothetical protein
MPVSMIFIISPPIEGETTIASVSGENQDDLFGWNVSGAGDINFDGYSDFIVGAPGYDNERGRAYIFLGSPSFSGNFTADSANITINGSAQGDRFGWAVTGGGDVNFDGFDDIIIGAPGNNSDTGSIYIIYGNDPMPDFINSSDSDVTIVGESAGDNFGSSVSIAGDVNNDGYDDVIVGSPEKASKRGEVYVFHGSDPIPPLLTVASANLTLFGENPQDRFGHSVSGAGDVNNDNFDDVIIGAPGANKAYLYLGGNPMNAWIQTTQSDFDAGTKVYTVTDMVEDGELKLDTFYDIKAMMAYNGSGSNIPRIRTWDQNVWGAWSDSSAPDLDDNYWFELESGTVRKNEKILGVQDSGFDLNLQVWNGSSWGPVLEHVDVAVNPDYRSFDIAYESQSGDAMVAYLDANSGDIFPKYRIWNGTSWGPQSDTLEEGTGPVYWIVLASNPKSDEILMVTLDSNNDIWAQVWDGDAWGDNISIEVNAPDNAYQCFDAAYESQSGYGFIGWADNAFNVKYRRWKGNWTEPDASWGLSPGTTRFIKLASEPNSNYILAARLDDSSEIVARVWDGSSWGLSKVVTPSPKENTMACFDVAWESKSDKEGIIAYGITNDAPMYRNVTGNEINDTESTSLDPNPDIGDPNRIVLESDPQSDDIMMMYMVSDPFIIDDIGVEIWNGSDWEHIQNVENASKRINGQRFDLAYTDTSGRFISTAFDGESNISWGRIKWNADIPNGTTMKIRTRTSSDNSTWSSWSTWYNNGDRITSPSNRYILYQVWFETTNVTLTSILNDITIELNLPDLIINGTTGENLGWSVSKLGDIDGDNFDDIIIGAPNNSSGQGSAYIFLGNYITTESTGDRFINLSNGDLANYTLTGESSGDMFGYSVSSAGYFNNDGILDVIIGAPNANGNGSLYVFFGGPTKPLFIPASQSDYFFEGENASDDFGWSVAWAGNLDNDTAGYHEIIVGAPKFDFGGNTDAGRVYVLHMFNQPEIMISGHGSNIYQSTAQGDQVNLTVIDAGTNATWFVVIENDGSLNDTFDINIVANMLGGWDWELRDNLTWSIVNNGETIALESGESKEFTLDIFASINAINNEESWVEITISSQNDTNQKDSVRGIARVVDITLPEISDTTSGFPTTGDSFTITSTVTDNILLNQVNLTFWFNTTSGFTVPQNVSMNDLGGGIYDYLINIPLDALEIFYNISAIDSSLNWNETGLITKNVDDNDPPKISNIMATPPVQEIGSIVNLTVVVTDEFNVQDVKINISFPDGSWILEDMINGAGDLWYYENVFTDAGIYNYTIWTNDSNGNENQTGMFQFNITIPPPTVDYIQIRSEPNNMGVVINAMTYNKDETDIYYAAGYNSTYGYIQDVEVTWGSTHPNASVFPSFGTSTNFTSSTISKGSVFASFGASIQNSTAFEFTVSLEPKIIGIIPNILLEEDFGAYTIDLSNYAHFPLDPNKLSWDITGYDKSIINVSGTNIEDNHFISLISQEDKFGNMEVTYWLIDPNNNKVSQKAWINITPKNDAPTIGNCPNAIVRFDMPYSFDYTPYIHDIDNTLTELTLTVLDSDYVTVNGFVVTYNYPEKMLGDEVFVALTVSDSELSGSTLIKVKITSNYPPEIVAQLPDVTLYENEVSLARFDLDDFFTDQEGDRVTYSVSRSQVTITINENGTVDFSAPGEWSGVEQVTFRAVDIIGGIVEQTINVRVIPVNDPPVIDTISDIKIHHNYPYTIDLGWYISDKDNSLEELIISTSNPDNVTVNGSTLTLVYPEFWDSQTIPYTVPLVIYVDDGFYNITYTMTITVSDNFPPDILAPLDDLYMFEDSSIIGAYDLDEHFYDLDDDTIFYTKGNKSISVIIHDNNTIDFIPDPDWFGSELILIRASDMKEAFLEDIILVTVIPKNDAPTISEIPPQKGEYETEWVLDMTQYMSDIDHDLADLNITVDSPYVEVVGQVLVFNYPKNIKKDDVEITVSDGEFNTSVTMAVTITAPSQPTPEMPWILLIITVVLAILLIGAMLSRIARYSVEELFLITKSGMLIVHKGVHKEDDEKDKDIVASMFVAVQSFIKDAFAEDDADVLKRMDYGDKTVLINMGNSVLLTAFITGQESKLYLNNMKEFIDHLEERYEGAIEMWDGNYENLPEIDELLESFFDGTFKKKYLKSFQNNVEEKASGDEGEMGAT